MDKPREKWEQLQMPIFQPTAHVTLTSAVILDEETFLQMLLACKRVQLDALCQARQHMQKVNEAYGQYLALTAWLSGVEGSQATRTDSHALVAEGTEQSRRKGM